MVAGLNANPNLSLSDRNGYQNIDLSESPSCESGIITDSSTFAPAGASCVSMARIILWNSFERGGMRPAI